MGKLFLPSDRCFCGGLLLKAGDTGRPGLLVVVAGFESEPRNVGGFRSGVGEGDRRPPVDV